MSLQVCSCCGWSKVTTYHGLRTHQGKMGCTPKGVAVTEGEQQFMWGHAELTNNQKYIGLDEYASIKTDAGYCYSDMDLQVCHCGWSKVTTYHGLRTHQGMMGCTPKGMRIPKKELYDWDNLWEEADESKYQPAKRETVKKENVPRSSSTNRHTISAAITGRVKVEYNSSFSTPQRSSQKATKSRSQLQDMYTLPQGRRSDREPPTPAYPETVVRPQRKDRRNQTLSEAADSKARTGYWSTNSYANPPTAATIKGEPESPILQRSSKKAPKSRSGHQLQDCYALPQMNTLVREHPTPTYPVPVEERKKKERREQTLMQEYWSINSRRNSATTATIKEEPKSPVAVSQQSSQAARNSKSGYQPHDFSTGVQVTKLGKERPPIPPKVKIKELPTTTHSTTVVRPKEQRREDETLSQNVPVSRSVNSATATTIKERPKSPFSTPQRPVQRVTNSTAIQQLQEPCNGLQVNGSGREVSRIAPLATAVQPKVKDRKDRTPSQSVRDSTNFAAAETTAKTDPKSVCETAEPDSSTGLKVKELAQMFSAATTQEAAVRPKKKCRGERILSQVKLLAQELSEATTVRVTAVQPKENGKENPKLSQVKNVPDSASVTTQMNSASAEKTTEEDLDIYCAPGMKNVPNSASATTQMNSASAENTTEEDLDIYSAPAMKVKELAQMFSAITTNKTAIQPKAKHKGEHNLTQVKPLAQKVSATTAQVAAVQPKEKDTEDQNLTQVRPVDVKHSEHMRDSKVDRGRSSVKARQGSVGAEWLEIKSVFSEVVRVAEEAQQKPLCLSLSTLRTTTSTMMEQIHQKLEKMSSIELKWISKFAVDIKLDPTTAHRCLVSADRKKVSNGGGNQEAPGRFGNVLGLNRLTSGKSYWEVVVSNKTGWNLGVARGDANGRGKPLLNPDKGYWVTQYYDNKYAALTASPVHLTLKEKPQKVGVFVDHEEGLVSFYNVTARSHIYSFTECSFNGEIYPYFSVHLKGNGESVDPLIISTV